jgi:hypothetical protein
LDETTLELCFTAEEVPFSTIAESANFTFAESAFFTFAESAFFTFATSALCGLRLTCSLACAGVGMSLL